VIRYQKGRKKEEQKTNARKIEIEIKSDGNK
jgi:hypothetical protein